MDFSVQCDFRCLSCAFYKTLFHNVLERIVCVVQDDPKHIYIPLLVPELESNESVD